MMKKKIALFLAIAMALTLLAGCGSSQTSAPSGTTAAQPSATDNKGGEPVTFIMGTACPVSEDNQLYQWCEKFKALVEEATDGQIIIENHHANELGGERDLFEGVQLGTVDLCMISNGPVGNFVPEVMAFDFPFLFTDFDHVSAVFEGEIGDRLKAKIEETADVVMLDWAINGFRQLNNSKRPVVHPSDLKGMKVRTMENTIHMETFAAMGADPTPMNGSELYTALQQGTVDAMESPLTYIIPSKFYEVTSYLSITNHFYAPSVITMNKDKFNGLSAEQQAILLDCAEQASAYQKEFCLKMDSKLAEEAATLHGMEVVTTNIDEFREATKSVYDNHPEYADILAEIQALQ